MLLKHRKSGIGLRLVLIIEMILIAVVVSYFMYYWKNIHVDISYAQAEPIPELNDIVYISEDPIEPEPEEIVYEEEYVEPVYYEEEYVEPVYYEEEYAESEQPIEYQGAIYETDVYIEGVLTKSGGVNYYNGRKETWYSQKVLPGEGLDIPGRCVDSNGLIRDGDGYICVAASDLPYGTVIETSLGMGKVYDTGCAPGTTDIYTDW